MKLISTNVQIKLEEIKSSSPDEIETIISNKISEDLVNKIQKEMNSIYSVDGEFDEETETMVFKSDILITTSEDFEDRIEKIFNRMKEYMSDETASSICELLAE